MKPVQIAPLSYLVQCLIGRILKIGFGLILHASADSLKIIFFTKFFQGCHQSVILFGFRTSLMFSWA